MWSSCGAGLLPETIQLEPPPPQWYEQMRTPPAEVLLAEFRQQQQGLAAEEEPTEEDHTLMDSNEIKPVTNNCESLSLRTQGTLLCLEKGATTSPSLGALIAHA